MSLRHTLCCSLILLSSLTALADAPLSLTASDGTGLAITELDAKAVVNGPLAFTELHLTFTNPNDRVIEGQFRITLPQHAVVSRFAMKQETRWQEGEVVEKQAARRAYEDFLHRRQDPALLEQGAANEFTARVFPIPARGSKELLISYSQQLPSASSPYVLPLKGLPQVSSLSVDVAGGTAPIHLDKKSFVPTEDVVVMVPNKLRALRSAELVVVRVRPVDDTATDAVDSLAVLFDTSASRALGFTAQLALLKGVAEKLPATTPLTVIAFDQDAKVAFEGTAGSFDATALKGLRDRRALGASNLENALKLAANSKRARLLLLGDGVVTAGNDSPDELAALVKGLKANGINRFDTIGLGGIRDESLLHRLVTAGLSRDGAVIDGDAGVAEAVRRLQSATKSKLAVVVSGATFQWPKTLDAMQAGDEALVFAQLPKGAAVKVTVDGKPVDVSAMGEASAPLLERAVVQARIEALTDELNRVADGPKQKAEVQARIVELSVKHRVLSPFTALLVLETEQDYARFKIDRRALADILTVQNGQVSLLHRSEKDVVVPPPPLVTAQTGAPKPALKKMKLDASEARSEGRADGAPGSQADGAKEAPAEAEKMVADERPAPAPPPAPPRAEPVPRPARLEERSADRRRSAPSSAGAVARDRESEIAESDGESLRSQDTPQHGPPPYTGKFKQVMDLVAAHKNVEAMNLALGWREEEPGDVLALVALGEAAEAASDLERAARAYGSIIDLFSSRADLRRFAGVRLERLANGLALATDSFRHALDQRPDHPQSSRLLAYALVRQGKFEKAFDVLAKAQATGYPSGRFAGIERILPEDLGLVAAAWAKQEPARASDIRAKLTAAHGTPETAPSVRFVLNWETDANDVDFHIFDSKGGHAYYSARTLSSGGELYADVTTGYGPECFTIRRAAGKRAGPYTLQAHYYSRGPMGYGMGKLQVVEHDGAGGLRFEDRPFIVMVDQAFVDLGVVK